MTLTRTRGADGAASSRDSKTARGQLIWLQVVADHCPQILLRVLGLVARHGAIPHTIVFERRPRSLRIEVAVDALGPGTLENLAHKVGTIPTVRSARLRPAPR